MSVKSKIKKNIKLAPFTSFKIGGPAKYFIEIKNLADLVKSIRWAKTNKQLFTILAGGSNVLISDRGIKGLVIKLSLTDLDIKAGNISCGAGVNLAEVVKLAAKHGLTGLEWASGIPGTVGGAVYGNAGAFGSEMSQTVLTVKAYDVSKNNFISLSDKRCYFNYRDSIFKRNVNLIIIQVTMKLSKRTRSEIKYLTDKYIKYRLNSQPKYPSAGSIFKNLLLNDLIKQNLKLANEIKAKRLVKGGKVASAWFIDQLGLKGKIIGGAKISDQHANFIVNLGKAKAQDVINLINLIKKKVKDKYKIMLEEEIKHLGL